MKNSIQNAAHVAYGRVSLTSLDAAFTAPHMRWESR